MRADKRLRQIVNPNRAPRRNPESCRFGCGFVSKDQRKIRKHVCKEGA